MKQIVYDAQTKETTIIEVPDVEMPIIEVMSDPDVELATAISAATTLTQLKDALLGNGKLARVKGKIK